MSRWVLLAAMLIGGVWFAGGLAKTLSAEPGQAYHGKKILWVNSYHPGYLWGDGIGRGIRDVLTGSGVEVKVWYMDTLRNRSEDFGYHAGRRAKRVVEEYRPDVMIVSDDNAQRFLVTPHIKGGRWPVIFCGVNRNPAHYGYPDNNVTGMQEVDFVADLVRQMRAFAGGDRIGMIACRRETDRIIADEYNYHVFGRRLKVYLVETFDQFKDAFLLAQQEVDVLCLPNNAGIEGWEDTTAERFIAEHTRIPTGGLNPWMKPYVVFNLAKSPEEQGRYAARTALRILGGERPGDIPITRNSEAHLTINLKLAQAAGIVVPVSMLRTAELIGQDALQD